MFDHVCLFFGGEGNMHGWYTPKAKMREGGRGSILSPPEARIVTRGVLLMSCLSYLCIAERKRFAASQGRKVFLPSSRSCKGNTDCTKPPSQLSEKHVDICGHSRSKNDD